MTEREDALAKVAELLDMFENIQIEIEELRSCLTGVLVVQESAAAMMSDVKSAIKNAEMINEVVKGER